MRVVFRTDAALNLGTGHVVRCLTLAAVLRGRGAAIWFVSRLHDGHLCDVIEQHGFHVIRLGPPAASVPDVSWREDAEQTRDAITRNGDGPVDLLVVDHYGLDGRWERALRASARRVLVIDDLANRPHDCDLLLDPNLHDSPESRYAGLVGVDTRVFVGPRYALLRPEFEEFPVRVREQLRRVLVYFGGVDPTNQALQVLHAMRELAAQAPAAAFVLGPTNPHARSVHEAAQGIAGVQVIAATERMAQLMSEADLGIGACGGAAWERCTLGLPALVAVDAENQRDDARILQQLGAIRCVGDAYAIGSQTWVAEIRLLQRNPAVLRSMSLASAAVMAGHKVAMREIEEALLH